MAIFMKIKKSRGLNKLENLERKFRIVSDMFSELEWEFKSYEVWEDALLESLGGSKIYTKTEDISDVFAWINSPNREITDFDRYSFVFWGYAKTNDGIEEISIIVHNKEDRAYYGDIEIDVMSENDIALLESNDQAIITLLPKIVQKHTNNPPIIISAGPSPECLDRLEGYYRYRPSLKDILSDLFNTFKSNSEIAGDGRFDRLFRYINLNRVISYIIHLRDFRVALDKWSNTTGTLQIPGSVVLYNPQGKLEEFYNVFERDYISVLEKQFVTDEKIKESLRKALENALSDVKKEEEIKQDKLPIPS